MKNDLLKRKQFIFFWGNVLIPIFFGGIIYLSFRKESLLMFTWFDSFGLSFAVNYLRDFLYPYKAVLPNWFLYSLPDGLWLYSFVFFLSFLWENEKPILRIGWSLIGPVIAIGSEFGQIIKIFPGTYSSIDLLFYFTFGYLAFSIAQNKRILLWSIKM